MSQSQQQTQARDTQNDGVKMSINLPYIEGTSKQIITNMTGML